MTGFTPSEWIELMEKARFARVTDDTSGSDLLSSNVPEDQVLIPLAFIISDTAGAANSVDFTKSGEASGTIHGTFNLASNETVTISAEELSTIIPRLEGGANLQITAGSDGVDVTMVYVHNTEV